MQQTQPLMPMAAPVAAKPAVAMADVEEASEGSGTLTTVMSVIAFLASTGVAVYFYMIFQSITDVK